MTTIILFAPLIGALICGFGWRLIGEPAATWVSTGLLFLAAILSWVVFLGFDGTTQQVTLMRWLDSGTFSAEWAIRVDRLTAIMLVVINTVSALVHLYSQGYMAHDENFREGESYRPRFFAYLSFFTFAMLMLVTADNLLQLFFGWEGVGVASYLLIGFYFRKPSANAAAIKAFVVNRIGDFAFLLGIFALYFLVDSIRLDDIFAAAPELAQTSLTFAWSEWNAAELIAVLLFLGAMGKSAQLFLHTWLPDAMEGPTPVSALIHAATMVTAGVFLVCRMSPLIEYAPYAKTFIVYIGAATAFFAATVGLVQNDIKRVIAYSTCSQLGYMFVAAGSGVYSAAMFHLFTHAFFKALLFLCAGSVIHAMHHEQDMRNYGGLRKHIPYTFWAMVIGTLAITGVGLPFTYFGFAGFFSKDAIIESAYAGGHPIAFWLLVIAAVFTAFYSWWLIYMTFFGTPRWGHGEQTALAHAPLHEGGHADEGAHGHGTHQPHESPATMLIPLGVLSIGAVLSGVVWYNSFFGESERVASFFAVPYGEAEVAEAEGEALDTEAPTAAEGAMAIEAVVEGEGSEAVADEHGGEGGEHHGQLIGAPGEGAIHAAPGNNVLNEAHEVPEWVALSPFIAMLIGAGLAWFMYIRRPDLPGKIAATNRPLYEFLLNKWYFDEIYEAIFTKSAKGFGTFLWRRGDGTIIDGGINGVAMGIVPTLTRAAGQLQSGYMATYVLVMVLGIAALLTWFTIGGGAG